ncbi:MAG: amidophosphoribosyltransferase, partial [Okeania sp. SIO3H1]|nr:amidophosphoribosyltransferase [Okeania sp. SIO3H1]
MRYNPETDRFHDECGVFGIFGHPKAALLTALGLHALQHRGQESAGIVTFDGERFHSERHLGLVESHFTRSEVQNALVGKSAIGHVRYSTSGETILRNVQPLFAEFAAGGFAVCHNGNITNALALRKSLISSGAIFQSTSDTEVILHLMSRSSQTKVADRFTEAISELEGAFSLVALSQKKLLGVRDPFGIRPLVIGEVDGAIILTSETCALDIVGARYVRDVENGEIIVVTADGVESYKPFAPQPKRPCIFEFIYFARPDSIVDGHSVYDVRKRMGQELARETGLDVDVVIPVPDGGVPAALGFAQEAGIPFELGITRNHYVGRTFIQPTQGMRQMGVRLKHNANRSQVEGKRILLVDDSLVRGTTSVKIVQMMRDAGAKEVHLRVSSPPITHSDFYGIDTPQQADLMAHKYST